MKRFFYGFLWLLLAMIPGLVQAQTPVTTLAQLEVDIWPDFDQESVLVLLTGTLPEGTNTPATVTLPLPAESSLNAVARVDVAGQMFADIEFDDSQAGQLSLITPDPSFRVEYYYPYAADGDQRSFSFEWQSQMAVSNLSTSIQQPAQASQLEVSPEPVSVGPGAFGLQYYSLAPVSLAAGERYALDASYLVTGSELSSQVIEVDEPATEAPLIGSSPTFDEGPEINVALVGAGAAAIVLIAGVAWFVVSNRADRGGRVLKPKPVRATPSKTPRIRQSPASQANVKFCHECGQPLESGDRFCRNCGTPVKGVT